MKAEQLFTQLLGIPTPNFLQSKYKFKDINFTDYIVIKLSFSRSPTNVCFYFGDENIVKTKTNHTFDNLNGFKKETLGRHIPNLWQTEVLILNQYNKVANDTKVYMYYGIVKAVFEIKRSDKSYQCWYDKDGKVLEGERHNQPWFEGTGFDSEVLKYAQDISLNIPALLMRVDLYKGAKGGVS